MLRTERITAEDAIRHEIDTYNELLPRPGELTATMLIEYPDAGERDVMLRRLNAASSLGGSFDRAPIGSAKVPK